MPGPRRLRADQVAAEAQDKLEEVEQELEDKLVDKVDELDGKIQDELQRCIRQDQITNFVRPAAAAPPPRRCPERGNQSTSLPRRCSWLLQCG